MIKVENIEVYNIARAVYSARNALNSWDKSDSDLKNDVLGEADLDLARRLFKAGADGNFAHRKFLRQCFVCMDITAPLYWWKEFDTYKVGTTSNSCSTMHTIHKRNLTLDDFSHEHLYGDINADGSYSIDEPLGVLQYTIDEINRWREEFGRTGEKEAWYQIIQLLPTSFNQKRTITMNYENVFNILQQRQGHKLYDWRVLCEILKDLPYVREIGGIEDEIKSDS